MTSQFYEKFITALTIV